MEKTWEIFVKESGAHTFIIHTPPIYIGLLRYNTNIFGPKLKGPIHNTKPTMKYTTIFSWDNFILPHVYAQHNPIYVSRTKKI
jgi:hypothetical protein